MDHALSSSRVRVVIPVTSSPITISIYSARAFAGISPRSALQKHF
jgi:hypothetical protein